ncbi:MAG: phosphate ABC transporter permease subunit PstC, partial [Mycobacterium sp.]
MSTGPVTPGSAGALADDRPIGDRVDLTAQSRRTGEQVIKGLLAASALLSIAITAGIVVSLLAPLVTFFQNVSIIEFLTGTTWTAGFGSKTSWTDKEWGVLPLVMGTLSTTVIALLVAVPLGLGTAMYLSEYAN